MTLTQTQRDDVATILDELGLIEVETRPGHPYSPTNSMPVVAENAAGTRFLLKYYLPPRDEAVLPVGHRSEDYVWRETGFYRVLDTIDPNRREIPTPKTLAIGPGSPPRWLLLEHIEPAIGPREELLGQDDVLEILDRLSQFSTERLMGRRGFPIGHWEPVTYLEGVRGMYDAVLYLVGESRWRRVQSFFAEALRWTEGRRRGLVHGDLREENLIVDADGRVFVLDFENIGLGNEDHDISWFWIHNDRHPEWKRQLVRRWLDRHVGGDRIRTEWGMRATAAYLALRRLRWSYLTHGDEDPQTCSNLALLDAALAGGAEFFPLQ